MLFLRTMNYEPRTKNLSTNHELRTSPAFGGTGAERARTADPYLAKVVLSQLSYIPTPVCIKIPNLEQIV